MRTVPHFINGVRVEESGDLNVFNPATGEVTARVPIPSLAFINNVVEVATKAADEWGQSTLSRRTNILFSLRQLLVEHTDELAALITSEHGKTLADAKGEIARGLENVEYACGLIEHLKGGFSDQVAEGADVLLHDSQYSGEEYSSHAGWGHSSIDHAVSFARAAQVERLLMFHHDPEHTDTELESLRDEAQSLWTGRQPPVLAAEGVTLRLKQAEVSIDPPAEAAEPLAMTE